MQSSQVRQTLNAQCSHQVLEMQPESLMISNATPHMECHMVTMQKPWQYCSTAILVPGSTCPASLLCQTQLPKARIGPIMLLQGQFPQGLTFMTHNSSLDDPQCTDSYGAHQVEDICASARQQIYAVCTAIHGCVAQGSTARLIHRIHTCSTVQQGLSSTGPAAATMGR